MNFETFRTSFRKPLEYKVRFVGILWFSVCFYNSNMLHVMHIIIHRAHCQGLDTIYIHQFEFERKQAAVLEMEKRMKV